MISTKNKKRGTQEDEQSVLNAVRFGSTGPVAVTLWQWHVQRFLEHFARPVCQSTYFFSQFTSCGIDAQ